MVRPDQDPHSLDTLYQFIAEQFCVIQLDKKAQVLVRPAKYDPAYQKFFDALAQNHFTKTGKDNTRELSPIFLDMLKTNQRCRTSIIAYTILALPEWGTVRPMLAGEESKKALPELERKIAGRYEAEIAKQTKRIHVLESDVAVVKKNALEYARQNRELENKLAERTPPAIQPEDIQLLKDQVKRVRGEYAELEQRLSTEKDNYRRLEAEKTRWETLCKTRESSTSANKELERESYRKSEMIKNLNLEIQDLKKKVEKEEGLADIDGEGIDYRKEYESLKKTLQSREGLLTEFEKRIKDGEAELKRLKTAAEKTNGTALIEHNVKLQVELETLRTRLKLEEQDHKKCQDTLQSYKRCLEERNAPPAPVVENGTRHPLPAVRDVRPETDRQDPAAKLVYQFQDDYRKLELELHGPFYSHQTWTLFDADDRFSNRMYGLYLLYEGQHRLAGVYPNTIADLKRFGLLETTDEGYRTLTGTGKEIVEALKKERPQRFKDPQPAKRVPRPARTDLSLIQQEDP